MSERTEALNGFSDKGKARLLVSLYFSAGSYVIESLFNATGFKPLVLREGEHTVTIGNLDEYHEVVEHLHSTATEYLGLVRTEDCDDYVSLEVVAK